MTRVLMFAVGAACLGLGLWFALDHRDRLGPGWSGNRVAVVACTGIWAVVCFKRAAEREA